MNLALIDTKTHEVRVFDGKKLLSVSRFNTSLEPEQVEAIRVDSAGFIKSLETASEG